MTPETAANTQPGKQLEHQNNRLKEATGIKVYYRVRRDYIYIHRKA